MNFEVWSLLGTVSNETKKKEKNENVSEKIPPITEKIIKEAETAKSKEPTKETEKEAQNETSMFENESDEEAPLVLTDEVKNGKSTIINNHLSPAVRKIVNEQNIKLEGIKGSGKNGTILKGDLLKLMSKKPEPNQRKVKYGPEERIKMTRLRQTIAKRLKSAQENAAMLTTFNEVDMSEIISFRKNNQDEFQKKFGVKLGFMSFFVKASVKSLKSYPAINAEIENDDIIYKNYFNISFAVGTDKGLVVPVLKNADAVSYTHLTLPTKA